MDSPSILILTAGFGDGHNSAARSIFEALQAETKDRVRAVVVDLFEDAAPVTGALYKWCYRQIITYLPGLWHWLFVKSSRMNFDSLWWDHLVGIGAALERRLQSHQPDLIVLTYPVYPYFISAGRSRPLPAPPVFMVVTDSITIHPVWLQGKVDRLFVTDRFSQEVAQAGLAWPVPVEVSGFPVAPVFREFPARAPEADPHCLKVIYFASTARSHVAANLRGLLEHLPARAGLTVVMGRHESRLRPLVKELLQVFPHVPVQLLGWTRDVPRLLMEHDVAVSKAGGATVHECLAAGIPLLVNYIIPGQEEGNALLLERLGCGIRSVDPERTGALLAAIIVDGRLGAMRRAMALHRRPEGTLRIVREILEALESKPLLPASEVV